MIWLSLALAATPEDLATAIPAARAQLEACETTCLPEEGARAAFVVAIGTYVDTGLADGTLAATVRALDPALFGKLPPVLQDAATDALAWAEPAEADEADETDAAEPEPKERPAVAPGVPEPWAIPVRVRVRDASGAPVPSARIAIVGEGVERPVDAAGEWAAGGYWVSDSPRYFAKGDAVGLTVAADGYAPLEARVVLTKNPKRNVFTLVLRPQ